MDLVKMVALKRHPFGTGTRELDEEYPATKSEADTLVALGWARLAGEKVERPLKPAKKAAKKATYRTRDMKAQD